jgi:hypothetical protein
VTAAWRRAKYPPKWPFAVGFAIQAVGYVALIPAPLVGVGLIYGGGLVYLVPFALWIVTPGG